MKEINAQFPPPTKCFKILDILNCPNEKNGCNYHPAHSYMTYRNENPKLNLHICRNLLNKKKI